MLLISGTTEFYLDDRSAVAIGKFDGIHRGHQELLRKIKETGLQTVVFTFDPPPNVFFGHTEVRGITTREEKRRIFQKQGIDILIEYPLNEKTAATKPEEFIEDILVHRIKTAYIAAGADLSFGSMGAGNSAMLEEFASRYDYRVEIIDKIMDDGCEVSSSRIREEVKNANMEAVHRMIGFPYSITGEVVHGNSLGHRIGFPTANIIPPADKLLPPRGVYFSYVSYGGKHVPAISNVGMKPTVNDNAVMGVETFLFDFDEDLYGKTITVNFLAFQRAEEKFSNVEELRAKLMEDTKAAKEFHKII